MIVIKFEEVPMYDPFFITYPNGTIEIYLKMQEGLNKCLYVKSVDGLSKDICSSRYYKFTPKQKVQVFDNFIPIKDDDTI